MTVAMSMLVHGDAVRFNRGASRGDDFDFKYMRGRDGSVFPYVSSQCYKRYWRESLTGDFSPIIREKDARGEDKNQAFTSGDPMRYIDDDLFGYMIAGATEAQDDTNEADTAEEARRAFEPENLKDADALRKRLLEVTPLSTFILGKSGSDALKNASSEEDLDETILNLLDEAARKRDLHGIEGIKGSTAKFKKSIKADEVLRANREILLKTFSKELQENQKRATTRRTAPIRMHALVAFSGIKTAKDFQTFSRDVQFTGKNSIVNPAVQGIYSGWQKTRILIESHRIGKFYVGKNMDILPKDVDGYTKLAEPNPYSRGESVEYVTLDEAERLGRLQAALQALANIGNKQGPASGALHDGSLRPKAFVAATMKCADSPFDYVWNGRNDDAMPDLNIGLLCDAIQDWEDLFATKKIYIGLPGAGPRSLAAAAGAGQAASTSELPGMNISEAIKRELKAIGFDVVVDTPRKALLQFAGEVSL